MVQSKGIGMVFDGEGLAYYYKDLEKATWWKSQKANWNTALSEAITANKSYIRASVSCCCPYRLYLIPLYLVLLKDLNSLG